MKLLYGNKRYFYATALTCLLAGLLFSNGEGIRLLPFPTVAQASCGTEKLVSAIDAGYQENVTRFEKRQTPFALKKVKADAGDTADATGGVMLRAVTHSVRSVHRSPILVTESFAAQTCSSDLNSRPPPIS